MAQEMEWDTEKIAEWVKTAKRVAITAFFAIGALILLIGACSGFYQIRPGEAAAIQTFGAHGLNRKRTRACTGTGRRP